MGRILGLDYGTKRIGIAVSDELQLIAHPEGVVDREDLDDRLGELVAELHIEKVVVGLPVSLSGLEGAAARGARRLAQDVASLTGLPVDLYDERFTTTVAERVLVEAGVGRRNRRQVQDKLAAAVMLQGYLDGRR
ncbi:MAG: Holliday junction resolvase RuvX [Acidimicrobiia bacterium]